MSALDYAFGYSQPEVSNSDRGVQFTSQAFTEKLHAQDIRISLDGRGHTLNNILVDWLSCAVKYEEAYLHDYADVLAAVNDLGRYYNDERPHQSLAYKTPAALYWQRA